MKVQPLVRNVESVECMVKVGPLTEVPPQPLVLRIEFGTAFNLGDALQMVGFRPGDRCTIVFRGRDDGS